MMNCNVLKLYSYSECSRAYQGVRKKKKKKKMRQKVDAFTAGNPFEDKQYLKLIWGGILGLKRGKES